MQHKTYRYILYIIVITIFSTIAVQIFWNYKNYERNNERVINDIQISLDNAVENYYANVAKHNMVAFVANSKDTVKGRKKMSSFIKSIEFSSVFAPEKGEKKKRLHEPFKQIKPGSISGISIFKGIKADSVNNVKNLLNKIIISVSQDSIQFPKLTSYLQKELARKNIAMPFGFIHYKKKDDKTFYLNTIGKKAKTMLSKSTYLKADEKLELVYNYDSSLVLKRGLIGALLSLLFSLIIVACLFYLLHIIKQQKELATIKNDLISNITHEFKTPIATIATALEAFGKFNALGNTAKTEKYLNISNNQLTKLYQMVEKLLETATLDSEKLLLQKEPVNIIELTQKTTEKQAFINTTKNISFTTTANNLLLNVDVFHFENALTNLIDNALKYGGNTIKVEVTKQLNHVEIDIFDNGEAIDKQQREKIFDKFYRIPKGNTHNVKGFGIGLYYTKKIIEKHGGTITLEPHPKNTLFKITLPLRANL